MTAVKVWFLALVAALVSLVFPIAAERFSPSVIFSFFGVMMVLHLLWAVFVVRFCRNAQASGPHERPTAAESDLRGVVDRPDLGHPRLYIS